MKAKHHSMLSPKSLPDVLLTLYWFSTVGNSCKQLQTVVEKVPQLQESMNSKLYGPQEPGALMKNYLA